MSAICEKCGDTDIGNNSYCRDCGGKFVPMPKCQQCGEEIWPRSNFCRKCGLSKDIALEMDEAKRKKMLAERAEKIQEKSQRVEAITLKPIWARWFFQFIEAFRI